MLSTRLAKKALAAYVATASCALTMASCQDAAKTKTVEQWVHAAEAARDPDDKIAALSMAISLEPGNPSLYLARARAYEGGSSPTPMPSWRLAAALADLDVATNLDPKNVMVLALRSAVLASRGEYDEAMADNERAIEASSIPEPSPLTADRAYIMLLKGDDEGARRYIEMVCQAAFFNAHVSCSVLREMLTVGVDLRRESMWRSSASR